MDDRLTRLSKTLAYILRHQPESVGVELDPAGWIELPVLLSAMVGAGHLINQADLDQILRDGDKQRYELSAGCIRAAQGHSFRIQLGLEPAVPPKILYHGTVERFLGRIRSEGLRPGERTHVHLSAEAGTARVVALRRGKPVVLRVDAGQMHSDGHVFLLASSGVWLVDQVPPMYLA